MKGPSVGKKRAAEAEQAKKLAEMAATLDKKRAAELERAKKVADEEAVVGKKRAAELERAKKVADKAAALDKKRVAELERAKKVADKAAVLRKLEAGAKEKAEKGRKSPSRRRSRRQTGTQAKGGHRQFQEEADERPTDPGAAVADRQTPGGAQGSRERIPGG